MDAEGGRSHHSVIIHDGMAIADSSWSTDTWKDCVACRCIREEGDMPVAEWMQKEAEGTIPSGDYDVTAIVDERKRPVGKTQEFIVKWKASR